MKLKKFDDFTYIFLVNASQMAYIEDAHKTHSLLQMFNELYRYMIREDDESLLSGELKALQNYIDIQSTRYEGRFKITLENLLDNSDIHIKHLCLLDFVDEVLSNALTMYEGYFNIHLKIQIDINICATIILELDSNQEMFNMILAEEVK
jgi:LytS/YehU family sensor histidine kinase